MKWNLQTTTIPQSQQQLRQVMLENRGISNPETFFNPPRPTELSLEMVEMDRSLGEAACQRIKQALDKQEKIIVFGDYDADGICATTVMWTVLHRVGCKALPFIPDRIKHGYGLSPAAIQDILSQGKPDLVITVDNGIVAHAAVGLLNEAGVDVIITDHHSPEVVLPAAQHIVHTTKLCGTTVAWMLARELLVFLDQPLEIAEELLDVCGIATIADQVPLKDANRAFAYWGVQALKQTNRPGIKAICQIADIQQTSISTNSVHYGLAPRINAMGRLEHGMDALRLLCTTNPAKAQELAQSISLTNVRRQTLTSDLLDHALAQSQVWETEHLIIVDSPDYHEGVIGLIAGKLMETYYKPAIVLAVGETKAKASARSIAGVNIVELLRLVKDDLLEVGGHPMAAGFGVLSAKIPEVKEKLWMLAKTHITIEQLVPALSVEAELPAALVSLDTVQTLTEFEPFGQGNHKPMWCLRGLRIEEISEIGSRQQHLKLMLQLPTEGQTNQPNTVTGLFWNYTPDRYHLQLGDSIDVVADLESKTWKSKTTLNLILKDLVVQSATV